MTYSPGDSYRDSRNFHTLRNDRRLTGNFVLSVLGGSLLRVLLLGTSLLRSSDSRRLLYKSSCLKSTLPLKDIIASTTTYYLNTSIPKDPPRLQEILGAMALGNLLEVTQIQHLPLVFTSCLLVWYFRLLIHALFSPLRSVSGPLLARFTRLWYFQQVYTGRFPWTNIELHKKHGTHEIWYYP